MCLGQNVESLQKFAEVEQRCPAIDVKKKSESTEGHGITPLPKIKALP